MIGSGKKDLKTSGLAGLSERLQKLGAIAVHGSGSAAVKDADVNWIAVQEAAKAARARELEFSRNLRYLKR